MGQPTEAERGSSRRQAPRLVQAPVRPLDADGITAGIVGTVLWTLALALCWINSDSLDASGNGWWLGVCLVGSLIGVAGTLWVIRKRTVRHRQETATARDTDPRP